MNAENLKKDIDLLTKHCEYITEESDKHRREKDIYKTAYDNLFELVFNEKVHQILAACTVGREKYLIYTTNFIHLYETSFYMKYDSYFEMNFVMSKLSSSPFQQAAYAQVEIYGKNLKIINMDTSSTRCGYGGKLLECIENYARANGIEKIFGTVDVGTHIGLENLIRFYEKQGCTVYEGKNGLKFKKELDKKES